MIFNFKEMFSPKVLIEKKAIFVGNFAKMSVLVQIKVSKLHICQFYFNETVSGNVPGKITVKQTL